MSQAGETCYTNTKASAVKNSRISVLTYMQSAAKNSKDVQPYLESWRKMFLLKNRMSNTYFKEHVIYPTFVRKEQKKVKGADYVVFRVFLQLKFGDYYISEVHPKDDRISLLTGTGKEKRNEFVNSNEFLVRMVKGKPLPAALVLQRYKARYIAKTLKPGHKNYDDVIANVGSIRINGKLPAVLAGCGMAIESALDCPGIQYLPALTYDARNNKVALLGSGENGDQCYSSEVNLITGKAACQGPFACMKIGL